MEYIAFLFLGIGVLLVVAGILLQGQEKRGQMAVMGRSLNSSAPEKVDVESSFKTSSLSAPLAAAHNAPKEEPTILRAPIYAVPSQHSAPPGPFQFVQNEPSVSSAAQPVSPVAVSVAQTNPRLFERFAHLYLDSSDRNVYDGAGSLAAFDLNEVSGIRRFGRGVFSYDGFGFYFDHTSGQERFPLSLLKTIGFYPNCIALTFRSKQPVALLFMEETESIRKVLETFRVENAGV